MSIYLRNFLTGTKADCDYRDDEYIMENAYLEQTQDVVPLITGFNYNSKIFRRESSEFVGGRYWR